MLYFLNNTDINNLFVVWINIIDLKLKFNQLNKVYIIQKYEVKKKNTISNYYYYYNNNDNSNINSVNIIVIIN